MNTPLEQQSQETALGLGYKERESKPVQPLEDYLAPLAKYGGFALLEQTVAGAANLNPTSKARKNIFLTESGKKKERAALKETLGLWLEAMEGTDNIADMITASSAKAEVAAKNYRKNMRTALKKSRKLEENYRALNLFFKNTDYDSLNNLTILNATNEQVNDLDNPTFFEAVREELDSTFNQLDLRKNYSIMALPGVLKSNAVIEKWGKVANKNKVMLVTDYLDLDKTRDLIELFDEAKITGGEDYKSNVTMACNYLVGRAKDADMGEEEDVSVAPSAALAGKMYGSMLAQVAAGTKFGGISEVSGVKLDLRKTEVSELEAAGLVPMIDAFGKVMAYSGRTIFSGDNEGKKTYSVVRVFDYVMKVLMHFLNQRAFENVDNEVVLEIRGQINKFLDKLSGPGKMIEKYEIRKFERDRKTGHVMLDIHMVPFFPGKTFLIALDGMKGDDGVSWDNKMTQS